MLEIGRLCEAKEYLAQKRVVIFDMDDTLYPEKDYVRSGYAAVAQHYPKIANMADKLWHAFECGKQAINFVLEQEGLLSDESIRECLEVYRNHFPEIKLYSEASQLLQFLKENGTHLGLITDGRPEGQRAKIEALGLEPYFEKIIITDELGGVEFRKPNKAAFEIMQKHFGVPFETMVYVGDNQKKDFIAPRQLGMDSVYFKNPDGLYSEGV